MAALPATWTTGEFEFVATIGTPIPAGVAVPHERPGHRPREPPCAVYRVRAASGPVRSGR